MSSTDFEPSALLAAAEGLLEDLVGFASVSGASNADIIAYVRNYLADHGVAAELDPHADGKRFNLFATQGPPGDGGIVLCGHTDVVPADPAQWAGDPFALRRIGETLIGRGAVDMKGFVACVLAMVPVFRTQAAQFHAPLHIALTFDEEVGCFGAAQFGAFLDRLNVRPDIMIIGEPTDMKPVMGHKAIIEMVTEVHGSAGHASDPRDRVNAIAYAARLIAHMGDVAAQCAAQADPNSPFVPAQTTLNVGRIEGGEARNIIADRVTFDWEIRPTPPDDGRVLCNDIMAWARDVLVAEMQAIDPASGISFEELAYCPGMDARPNSPALKLIERLWTNAPPSVVPFGTDGGHFQSHGIDTVVFGPGRMDQMHQPEEAIARSELADCIAFLHRLGADLAGSEF